MAAWTKEAEYVPVQNENYLGKRRTMSVCGGVLVCDEMGGEFDLEKILEMRAASQMEMQQYLSGEI